MRKLLSIVALTSVLASQSSQAAIIFSDNFESYAPGSQPSANWSFIGNDAGSWNVAADANGNQWLQTASGPSNHDSVISFGVMNGVTTPDSFILSADIQAIGAVPNRDNTSPFDFAHIGFVWNLANFSSSSPYSVNYLRVHSNHVTHFRRGGPERILATTTNTINANALGENPTFHLELMVNSADKILRTTIEANGGTWSQEFTGADFDAISPHSGGHIGLLQFGERTAYDNVVLRTLQVPEPMSGALLLAGLVGIGAVRTRRCSRKNT